MCSTFQWSHKLHGRCWMNTARSIPTGKAPRCRTDTCRPPSREQNPRVFLSLSLWWEFGRASPPSYAISRVRVCNSSVHAPHTNPQVIISCQLEQVLLKDLICPTGGGCKGTLWVGYFASERRPTLQKTRWGCVRWWTFFFSCSPEGPVSPGCERSETTRSESKSKGREKAETDPYCTKKIQLI